MSRAYLDQSVSKALFLDIVNHPERPLGHLYKTHRVAVNRVYNEYRSEYNLTPYAFRKRYHRPSLDVVDLYCVASRIEVPSTQTSRMIFNDTSTLNLRSEDDVPVGVTIKQVQVRMRGREFSFRASKHLWDKGHAWLYTPGGEVSIRLLFKERCKVSSLRAELVKGPGSDDVVDFPYDLTIDIEIDTLAYACKGRKHYLKSLPDHPEEELHPAEFEEFRPSKGRHVYVIQHGKTLIVTGYDMELIEEEVLALGQGWKRKPLNNEYRGYLREMFSKDKLSIVDPRDAIRYTTRIETAIDSISGVTSYVAEFNGHTYRVLIDPLDDLSKFHRLDPYIVSGPTRRLRPKLERLANARNETVISFEIIVDEIESYQERNGINLTTV